MALTRIQSLTSNFAESFSSFPVVSLYFVTALVITMVFARLYTWATPHDEFTLIRKGNRSATISFVGTMVGFALPLASLIRVAANVGDLLIWSLVILVVQYAAYQACRLFLGRPPVSVEDTDQSRNDAVFTAGTGIVVGILNAACLN